ncbi:unnamed protein product [Scytosiphon promiscuus]
MRTYSRRNKQPAGRSGASDGASLSTPSTPLDTLVANDDHSKGHSGSRSSSSSRRKRSAVPAPAESATTADGQDSIEQPAPTPPRPPSSEVAAAAVSLERKRRHLALATVPVCPLSSISAPSLSTPSGSVGAFGVERRPGTYGSGGAGTGGGGGGRFGDSRSDGSSSVFGVRTLWGAGDPLSSSRKRRRPGVAKSGPAAPSTRRQQQQQLQGEGGSALKKRTAGKGGETGRTVSPASGKKEQMVLDFGQKSLGQRILCPRCNVLYVCGSADDKAQHASVCAQASRGVDFAGWKQERVKARFSDDGARVVEIREGDPAAHLAKLREVERLMDVDMGFAPGGREETVFQQNGRDSGREGKAGTAPLRTPSKKALRAALTPNVSKLGLAYPNLVHGASRSGGIEVPGPASCGHAGNPSAPVTHAPDHDPEIYRRSNEDVAPGIARDGGDDVRGASATGATESKAADPASPSISSAGPPLSPSRAVNETAALPRKKGRHDSEGDNAGTLGSAADELLRSPGPVSGAGVARTSSVEAEIAAAKETLRPGSSKKRGGDATSATPCLESFWIPQRGHQPSGARGTAAGAEASAMGAPATGTKMFADGSGTGSAERDKSGDGMAVDSDAEEGQGRRDERAVVPVGDNGGDAGDRPGDGGGCLRGLRAWTAGKGGAGASAVRTGSPCPADGRGDDAARSQENVAIHADGARAPTAAAAGTKQMHVRASPWSLVPTAAPVAATAEQPGGSRSALAPPPVNLKAMLPLVVTGKTGAPTPTLPGTVSPARGGGSSGGASGVGLQTRLENPLEPDPPYGSGAHHGGCEAGRLVSKEAGEGAKAASRSTRRPVDGDGGGSGGTENSGTSDVPDVGADVRPSGADPSEHPNVVENTRDRRCLCPSPTWSMHSTSLADSEDVPSPDKEKEGGRERLSTPLPTTVLTCEDKHTPAVVGVLQVWVHEQSRRQGVATRLVDTVREKLVYGLPLRREQMAFSQPTREGQAFAIRYTGGDGKLLVY